MEWRVYIMSSFNWNFLFFFRVKSDELVPVAPDLLKNLFKTMDFPGSEENEYVMKGNTSWIIIWS
jgi:hypothetical protein